MIRRSSLTDTVALLLTITCLACNNAIRLNMTDLIIEPFNRAHGSIIFRILQFDLAVVPGAIFSIFHQRTDEALIDMIDTIEYIVFLIEMLGRREYAARCHL